MCGSVGDGQLARNDRAGAREQPAAGQVAVADQPDGAAADVAHGVAEARVRRPPPAGAGRGVLLVRWAGPARGVAARVELRYLRTSGPGVTVTERAAAPGAPDRRPVVTRDMPGGAVVRTVLAGTVADVTGRSRDIVDLLAVAASLRPVAP